jgi:hypothetical protein
MVSHENLLGWDKTRGFLGQTIRIYHYSDRPTDSQPKEKRPKQMEN